MRNNSKIQLAPRCSWLTFICFAYFLLGKVSAEESRTGFELKIDNAHALKKNYRQGFMAATFHDDQSYFIEIPDGANITLAEVMPMTITYDYELQDGEMLHDDRNQMNPPGFDYVILEIESVRHLNRDTGKPVSLDEVYLHHFFLDQISTLGAESLYDTNVHLPDGYGIHVLNDIPFKYDVALLSNKNLAPIYGSVELAHKHCNECYYAPGKGSACTRKLSGNTACCGMDKACRDGKCACATTTDRSTTLSKYRIEMNFLVSKEMEMFLHVSQWIISAPSCFKIGPKQLCENGGARFHKVDKQPNEQPYFKSRISLPSPASGTLIQVQGHLHTGAVNVTFYKNDEIICSSYTEHGTNPDPSTNARNEQNHLISVSLCYGYDYAMEDEIRIETGDILTVESFYYAGTGDTRFFSSEKAAGEHFDAMSNIRLFIYFDDPSLQATNPVNMFDVTDPLNNWMYSV